MRIRYGTRLIFDTQRIGMYGFLMLGLFAAFAITYTYGNAGILAYGAAIGSVTIVTYLLFRYSIGRVDKLLEAITIGMVGISLLNGLLRFEILDAIRVNLSILLPVGVAGLGFLNVDRKGTWGVPAVIGLVGVYFLGQISLRDAAAGLNANTLAFLGYMVISLGFFWFKLSSLKILPVVYLLAGFSILVVTQCRNLIIVLPVCFILLLLPRRIWENRVFYRGIYIAVLLYTILAYRILRAFFSSELYPLLIEYINIYAQGKPGTLMSRVAFFDKVIGWLDSLPWYEKIFGRGIRGNIHCHNMFYQVRSIYGYLGTVLLYGFFIRTFEMGRVLIREKHDVIVLCCVITLIGHFILNGADLYLIGTDCVTVMPQIIMGIIIYKYRMFREEYGRLAHEGS